MNLKTKAALTLAAIPAALLLTVGPAAAGAGYDVTHTGGDIAGAWARGNIWTTSDGRVHLDGKLKDTSSADKKGAALRIHAVYADGGTRDEEVWNTNGAGAEVNIGAYSFASSVRRIQLKECQLFRASNGGIYVGACAGGTDVWSL